MGYQVEGKLLEVCTWQGRTLRLRRVQGLLARMFTSLKEE
ncbi:hypothetical protein METP2_02195 [Methanosarcinales archaeon]|nr:hypothetical protein METP2_02195 [Methanosarcinales archaeon]